VGGFFNPQNVASVNGEDITEQELNAAIQRLMANLGSQVADLMMPCCGISHWSNWWKIVF
jgi:hypothetical protein